MERRSRLSKEVAAINEKVAKLLESLRDAESFIGSPTTEMFMDDINPEYRLAWLKKVRGLLKDHGVRAENLSGRWHT